MRSVSIGSATLYLADSRTLRLDPAKGHALISDPPYGMNYHADNARFTGGEGDGVRGRKSWPRIVGDDEPFEPGRWIAWPEAILWGSNHYGARLPVGTTLVWVKRHPSNFGKFLSDAEIAWQKGGLGVYAAPIEWSAQGRRSEGINNLSVHPAQKPIELMRWCIERTSAHTIVDPFMGSGTTIVAALQAGRRAIGVEMVPEYFETACRRVAEANRQPNFLAAMS